MDRLLCKVSKRYSAYFVCCDSVYYLRNVMMGGPHKSIRAVHVVYKFTYFHVVLLLIRCLVLWTFIYLFVVSFCVVRVLSIYSLLVSRHPGPTESKACPALVCTYFPVSFLNNVFK